MKIEIAVVNEDNLEAILNLKVSSAQKGFIETTKECIDEAKEEPHFEPAGLYINNELVGFAMYGNFPYPDDYGRVWLDRFLIDVKHQGKGYSVPLIKALIQFLKDKYHHNAVYLSIYEDNERALKIYKDLGFEFNGEKDINGELVMVLNV